MKTNRRNFLEAGAIAGTSLVYSPVLGVTEEKKQATKLPHKNTLVAENELRRDKPKFLDAPSFEQQHYVSKTCSI